MTTLVVAPMSLEQNAFISTLIELGYQGDPVRVSGHR